MAINRFMKPWKRDLTTDYYTPNFEAWAKLLDKKDTDMEETLAGADKLSSLIPEAGLRLRDDRNAYLQEINAQKEAITNSLYETGNTSEARRRIRSLSSDILSSPRLPMYNIDKTFMPEAMKLTMSQTSKSDIYGTPEDQWYDPQTGQVKQTTYDKYDPASAYAYTKTQDTHEYFHKMGDFIKPVFDRIKTLGDELVAKKYIDDDGKEKTMYYLQGQDVQREFIDAKRLMEFLDPDGEFGSFIEEQYRNNQGDARAFWDAKYRGLSEDERVNKFMEDALAANFDRIYDKTTNETFLQSAGKPGKTSSSSNTDESQPKVATSQTDIGIKFDNIYNKPIDIINGRKQLKKEIDNIEKDPKFIEANKRLKATLGITDPDNVIERTSDGGYRLNEHYLQDLTPQQQSAIYDTRLDGFTNIYDYMTVLSNKSRGLREDLERHDELLNDLDLGSFEMQTFINKNYDRIEAEATQKVKADREHFEQSLEEGYNRDIFSEWGMPRNPTPEEMDKYWEQRKVEEVESRTNSLLMQNPAFRDKMNKASETLRNVTNKVFVRGVPTYFLFGTTNKEQTAVEGMKEAVDQAVKARNVEIKNPHTDEIITGDARDKILEALNDKLSGKKKEDLSYAFKNDFQVFFDPEESRYKLLVNIRNHSDVANEMETPLSMIEVPFSQVGTSMTANGQNIEEFMNIEGNTQIVNDLNKIAEQYSKKGTGVAKISSDVTGNDYYVGHDVLKSAKGDSVPTYMRIKTSGQDSPWRLDITDPREAMAIKDLIEGETGLANMPKSVNNVNFAVEAILGERGRSLPSLIGKGEKFVTDFVNRFIGSNVNTYNDQSENEFIDVSAGRNIVLSGKLNKGLRDLAARSYGFTGEKLNVTDGYDPDRINEKSLHITGDAFDVRYSDKLKAYLEKIMNEKLVPGKRYKLPKDEFSGLSFVYETDESSGKNKDYTGTHFHFGQY